MAVSGGMPQVPQAAAMAHGGAWHTSSLQAGHSAGAAAAGSDFRAVHEAFDVASQLEFKDGVAFSLVQAMSRVLDALKRCAAPQGSQLSVAFRALAVALQAGGCLNPQELRARLRNVLSAGFLHVHLGPVVQEATKVPRVAVQVRGVSSLAWASSKESLDFDQFIIPALYASTQEVVQYLVEEAVSQVPAHAKYALPVGALTLVLSCTLDPAGAGFIDTRTLKEWRDVFGPTMGDAARNCMALFSVPGFLGHMSVDVVQALLSVKPVGTFAVTFGSDGWHSFVVHAVTMSPQGVSAVQFRQVPASGHGTPAESLARACADLGTSLGQPITQDLSLSPWFHGRLASKEATQRLTHAPERSFLFRLSESTPGALGVAMVVQGSEGRLCVVHELARPGQGGGYVLGGQAFQDAFDLVASNCGLLRHPILQCGGSYGQLSNMEAVVQARDSFTAWAAARLAQRPASGRMGSAAAAQSPAPSASGGFVSPVHDAPPPTLEVQQSTNPPQLLYTNLPGTATLGEQASGDPAAVPSAAQAHPP